ncbi:unnamed protein product [Amoebophrya sp. A120]|nr:unnamed protein product [Amoebophrya sp. A120]|eukprot:GSA120T00007936001.1
MASSSAQNLTRIPIPPADNISAIRFSPDENSSAFAVASWDSKAYIYRADQGTMQTKFTCPFPTTDCCWLDSTKVVFTSLDARITVMDARTSQIVAQLDRAHDNGIRAVSRVDHGTIITGSWDRKVKQFDIRSMKNTATAPVSAKVFCQDITPEVPAPSAYNGSSSSSSSRKLVVGGHDKKIHVFELRGGSIAKIKEEDSALKYQLRAIACMPDGLGYVQGSVEGRASWDYFEPDMIQKKFAFKCHREQTENGMEHIFPVHDIAFHPKWHTFATVGGDGTLCMWDGQAKKRIWKTSKFDDEISALSFSANGQYLAMGVSSTQSVDGPKEIWIKQLADHEVVPRSHQLQNPAQRR